jgi:hypothetical protein
MLLATALSLQRSWPVLNVSEKGCSGHSFVYFKDGVDHSLVTIAMLFATLLYRMQMLLVTALFESFIR